ncbi:MAG: S8 family peptidase [bacterium]|nr:S8 family peptidase [bacterium]
MQRVRELIGAGDIRLKPWQGHGITVAVLDTGMVEHPDLEGSALGFYDFVKGKGRKTACYDDNGHGTHVCGILCGSGRMSEGKYRGIAPASRLVVCKVLDDQGDGCMEQMLQGLLFVEKAYKRYDIRAVNISVGIGQLKDRQKVSALAEAVQRLWKLGLVVVCAAGNKGPGDNTVSAIGLDEKIIMVGCHDGSYRRGDYGSCSLYSGRGQRGGSIRKPDLVAPGTDIMSCNAFYQRGKKQEFYVAKSGTSMATPIVTGCAALLLQKEPYLSNNQVRDRLIYSARDLGAPWNQQGWGMVNLKNLFQESY